MTTEGVLVDAGEHLEGGGVQVDLECKHRHALRTFAVKIAWWLLELVGQVPKCV